MWGPGLFLWWLPVLLIGLGVLGILLLLLGRTRREWGEVS